GSGVPTLCTWDFALCTFPFPLVLGLVAHQVEQPAEARTVECSTHSQSTIRGSFIGRIAGSDPAEWGSTPQPRTSAAWPNGRATGPYPVRAGSTPAAATRLGRCRFQT